MHRRIRPVTQAFLPVVLVAIAACTPPPQVTLDPIGFEDWKRTLASLQGRIVVVDFWATWCVPCIERFPHMVRLHHQYRNRGVTFVSISLDNRDDKQAVEEARRFLVRQKATLRNYLMNENILEAFEKLDLVGIPAVLIYDRQGRLRHRLTGDDPNRQFTEKDVEHALAALLAGQEAP